ncbi:Uma2 family endonuclease [Actinomadura sp. 7K507]|uniref:Uma2 family endonuclease n=1 Tax=Actinomadura sp. 7K507 TaxID=2530365 RepID=UPI00104DDF59|nr:Uma2 family endonuclease [Actinomadura sp. 7K507]TDC94216.1 Uma2 family endonuclease [Actinomadura sp. 7K507]
MEDLHALEAEGSGFELEDGWLIELRNSALHNVVAGRIRKVVSEAGADSKVFVNGGGAWEISTPAGIRKPDVFVIPGEVLQAGIVDRFPAGISGRDVLLMAEVISPCTNSERTDRVTKLKEYAALGIPQYWMVEFSPRPKVQVHILDNEARAYRPDRTVHGGETLEVVIPADKRFTVRFDPKILTERPERLTDL